MNFYHRLQANMARCWQWLLQALFVQLFLTLFSWPILLWWGLPISVLTMVGNIIFNPFIVLFLLFSAGLFFCELLGLPSGIFVALLELLTNAWLAIMAYGSPSALIAFAQPSWWFAALIPAIAVAIVYRSVYHNSKMAIVALGALLLGIGFFLKILFLPAHNIIRVPYGNRAVFLVQRKNFFSNIHTVLLDSSGVLRNDTALVNWVDFTLKPCMAKNLGAVDCDSIIIMKVTKQRLLAAQKLAQSLHASIVIASQDKVTQKFIADPLYNQAKLYFVDGDILKTCCSSTGTIYSKKLWYIIDNVYVLAKVKDGDGNAKNDAAS